jgi:glutamate/tyrosine decarboxylase-like PLP-dependent enzyme
MQHKMMVALDRLKKIIGHLQQIESEEPVLKPLPPDQLKAKLDLHLDDNGIGDDAIFDHIQDVLTDTPRTGTNLFFNQLFGGRSAKAVVADMLASYMNNSLYTYKVGGPHVLIEKEMVRKMCDLLGYGEDSDGTMAPGGSMTNFMGMLMGRDKVGRSVTTGGVQQPMVMYASMASHYSLPKNAAFMGIGRDHLRFIETDEKGSMDIVALKRQVDEDKNKGLLPFLIVATAGTTVMGSFDDITACSQIAKEHGMWLHVDGAYCGSAMFSPKYRKLIQGAHLADSFSFNAHKMMGVPLSCSFIMVKDRQHLYDSFSNDADYLYQTDGDDLNLGKISIQCGRRNDALKFWAVWKAIGTKGLGEMVEHHFELANYALDYVRNHPDYTVYSYENSVNICFNYKDVDPKVLCNSLYEKGELMVGYGQFNGDTFVRLVAVNANNTKEDIDRFFEKMEAFVEQKLSQTAKS